MKMNCSKIKKVTYLGKLPVMDIMVDSEPHLFYANGFVSSNCAAHAKAYSVYSAVQLWLQEHYFLEYMCVLLSHIDRAKEKKGIGILNERIEYCIKHGVTIHYPDVNKSGDKWIIEAGSLIAPLKNIKSISDRELNIIESNRPYKDLKDFLDKTNFNNKRFEVLLFAHAFDKFGQIEDLYNWYYNNYFESEKKVKVKEDLNNDLFAGMGFDENEKEESSCIERNVTFSKSELEEKCLDLNGFVIPDNIIMKYYDVYNKKIQDFMSYSNGTKIGNSKIYKLDDLSKMQKGENSEPVWALAQVQKTVEKLKTKNNRSFSKVFLSDGFTKFTLFVWKSTVPSYFKRGNVMIIPFKVVTDEEKKENRISFAEWALEKSDGIPILYQEDN